MYDTNSRSVRQISCHNDVTCLTLGNVTRFCFLLMLTQHYFLSSETIGTFTHKTKLITVIVHTDGQFSGAGIIFHGGTLATESLRKYYHSTSIITNQELSRGSSGVIVFR